MVLNLHMMVRERSSHSKGIGWGRNLLIWFYLQRISKITTMGVIEYLRMEICRHRWWWQISIHSVISSMGNSRWIIQDRSIIERWLWNLQEVDSFQSPTHKSLSQRAILEAMAQAPLTINSRRTSLLSGTRPEMLIVVTRTRQETSCARLWSMMTNPSQRENREQILHKY